MTDGTTPETDAATLDRLVRARFSCRAFRPDPVPDPVITRILDTARHAASWSNTQPWTLVITRPETSARLSAALLAADAENPGAHSDLPYPAGFSGVHLQRRRGVGFGLYAALGIAREDRHARHEHHLNNFRFFGAPHVALLFQPADMGPYGALDVGGFVATFLLAARANGVDTLAQAALAQHAGVVRDVAGVDAGRAFVCGIAFGYARADHPANLFRSTRAELDELVRFA